MAFIVVEHLLWCDDDVVGRFQHVDQVSGHSPKHILDPLGRLSPLVEQYSPFLVDSTELYWIRLPRIATGPISFQNRMPTICEADGTFLRRWAGCSRP